MSDDIPSDEPAEPVKSKGGRPKGKKDDPRIQRDRKLAKILELAAKNLLPEDIAKACNLPESTVRGTIKRFESIFPALAEVKDYRDVKADILSAGQLMALKSALSGNKLDKSSFLSTLMGFEILNKAERLDLGKSTENHAHLIFGKVNVESDTKDDWIDANPSE